MRNPLDLQQTMELPLVAKTTKDSPIACISFVSIHCKISVVSNGINAAPSHVTMP